MFLPPIAQYTMHSAIETRNRKHMCVRLHLHAGTFSNNLKYTLIWITCITCTLYNMQGQIIVMSIVSCKTYNLLFSPKPEILSIHDMRVEPDLLNVILVLLVHLAATAACDHDNYSTCNSHNDHTHCSSSGSNHYSQFVLLAVRGGCGWCGRRSSGRFRGGWGHFNATR